MSPDLTTNDLRQRGPPSSRNIRLPRSSTQAHRTSPKKPKQSKPKPSRVMTKCYSEPLMFQPSDDGNGNGNGNGDKVVEDDCGSFDSGEGGVLSRFHTLDDVLSFTPRLIDSPLSRIHGSYDKDAKVLITVTVEGSPGPIRTLVKLGTSVEDTINLIVQRYGEEGRTPRLDKDSFSFDLHVSYFSLESLDRTDAIGEAGSRSFYLRKNSNKCNNERSVASNALTNSDGIQYDDAHTSMLSPSKQLNPTMGNFPPFFARKMNKIERRFIRLFKVLGCLDSK